MVNRQSTDWQKLCENYLQVVKLKRDYSVGYVTNSSHQEIENKAKGTSRQSTEEVVLMTRKYRKGHWNSLVNREIRIKKSNEMLLNPSSGQKLRSLDNVGRDICVFVWTIVRLIHSEQNPRNSSSNDVWAYSMIPQFHFFFFFWQR